MLVCYTRPAILKLVKVPAIAKKSFDLLHTNPEYMGIVQSVINRLKKISNPIKRTRFVHKLVDEYLKEVFSDPLVKKLSPCKEGCSLCCHTEVSITLDEAELLVKKIKGGIEIDLDRLQAQAENAARESYFKIPFEERKCVFLSEKGACRVYEDRPSVCRTNAVVGTNEQCDSRNGPQPMRLVLTKKADMVVYGSFIQSQDNDCLPVMVNKVLSMEQVPVT